MSIIENGLRADIMRKRMEDKNTLQNKGSLYVGIGNGQTTAINPSNDKTYQVLVSDANQIPSFSQDFGDIRFISQMSDSAVNILSLSNPFTEVKATITTDEQEYYYSYEFMFYCDDFATIQFEFSWLDYQEDIKKTRRFLLNNLKQDIDINKTYNFYCMQQSRLSLNLFERTPIQITRINTGYQIKYVVGFTDDADIGNLTLKYRILK